MAGLSEKIRSRAHTLRGPADLDPLIAAMAGKRVVMLGEASHGTKEYYDWRAHITKRLITEHGFSFVAVEGDWPDCFEVNRYVKGYSGAAKSPREALGTFQRWPTWMWANAEVEELVGWLKEHNETAEQKAGFYGFDLYSLWESMEAIIEYLQKTDAPGLQAAYRAYHCFEPYGRELVAYAHSGFVRDSCRDEVAELLARIRRERMLAEGEEQDFNTEQNALVAHNAEHYYRTMLAADEHSWNVRDRHMAETLDRLMAWHGPDAKCIVWAHNTHIGDARATSMREEGMINIGQLARETYGDSETFLLGFGSYKGSVIAGSAWGAPHEIMPVPEARAGSWEAQMRDAGLDDSYFLTADLPAGSVRGHRAIGVVYRPMYESGNYVPTDLARRYDAFVFLNETRALTPLPVREKEEDLPETYPSGV